MAIVLKQKDVGKDLNFAIKDSAGEAVSLADVTEILFKMKALNATTEKVSGECDVVGEAVNGLCTYTTVEQDLDTAGNYRAELQLTYSDGEINTAELQDVFITEDL